MTTNDDNVFALDGATGKVIWQYKPPNSGMFKNFGIVANRGLAYCDGTLFMLTLDMKLVALRPADGKVLGRDGDRRSDVPERGLELRLLRDERADLRQPPRDRRRGRLRVRDPRLRDGVHDRPEAGLAEPVLDDPARLPVAGARASRIVGGGAVWTPITVDTTTNTLYFGTGSATPLYFPGLRPGRQPAHRLADRRRPDDRPDEVVAAADRRQPVGLRRRRSRRSSTRARSAARRIASSRSRRWKASGSRSTRRPASRSTSASR